MVTEKSQGNKICFTGAVEKTITHNRVLCFFSLKNLWWTNYNGMWSAIIEHQCSFFYARKVYAWRPMSPWKCSWTRSKCALWLTPSWSLVNKEPGEMKQPANDPLQVASVDSQITGQVSGRDDSIDLPHARPDATLGLFHGPPHLCLALCMVSGWETCIHESPVAPTLWAAHSPLGGTSNAWRKLF